MAIALFLTLFFLSDDSKRVASVVGGIGFGTFIDELGKFITRDNNYFYQPAIAIIYLIFVALYLIFRAYKKYQKITPDEYVINSLEYMKEAIIHDLDEGERNRAVSYLTYAQESNPLVKSLKTFYAKVAILPPQRQRFYLKIKEKLILIYMAIISHPLFTKVITGFFLIQAIGNIFVETAFAFGVMTVLFPTLFPYLDQTISFYDLITLSASSISGVLIIIGVLIIRRSRINAYRFFKRSVLISILVTQVFAFYTDQLSAIFSTLFYLLLLITLNFMIEKEHVLRQKAIVA